ncbi:MAG TPA: hypothetical protein VHK91_05180 [Flavisolibacter sp.]|jgi:hypothetical protein|nr:hypothetical protein [Flavisolibacter sp.]
MKRIFTFSASERLLFKYLSVIPALVFVTGLKAQKTVITDSSHPGLRTVIAGKEYKRSFLHDKMWGEDYRKEWYTPVTIPVLDMDTTFGGLTPVKEGGGRQTKSLRLVDAKGRQYVLRSVNKTYTGALPEIALGTFVEKLANDQIATNHPYAALTVPLMAEAAGVPHTNPKYYVVPYSERLVEYNETFANMLCLLEERPDDTQISQPSFGFPEDIVSTEKMLEKMEEENDHLMDQHAYVKTRLFDMFVGDWGRHKDNWRWAKYDSGKFKYYRPVPKDRDQTYAKFEGFLLSVIVSGAGLKQLQTFDEDIRNIEWYNYPAIGLDRRFTNQLLEKDWIDSAKALQQYLTDDIIERSVRNMPAEAFALTGEEIIEKLKTRRNDLVKYASDYYKFIMEDVDIPGSKQNEKFVVKRLNDDATQVTVYRVNKEGEIKKPIYNRIFSNKETDEIRLYGIGGNDIYQVEGIVNDGIKVRIIGGPDKDSLNDVSLVKGGAHKTKYYDNPGNYTFTSAETKLHLSTDSSINKYDYETFHYSQSKILKVISYNNLIRFHVGLGYGVKKTGWRHEPYTFEEAVGINYSLVEKTFSPYYTATWFELLGHWNLNFTAGYDGARRYNYFGIGNETVHPETDAKYNWLRTSNFYGGISFDQTFKKHNYINLEMNYDGISVIGNDQRFISKNSPNFDPSVFDWKHFGTARLSYTYTHVNDEVMPSKGIRFVLGGSYTQNIKETSRHFTNAFSNLGVYIPLFKPFSLAIKTGAASQQGDPEFYQLNNIGGYYSLRGFLRYRFYGKSVFYNQNELRWVPNVRGSVFNGRMGLIGLFDNGRVWNPGETSDKWHYGYGGGIILVPFNKLSMTVTYSKSDDDKVINLHFGKLF